MLEKPEEKIFSEREVNEMLEREKLYLRLDSLERLMQKASEDIANHTKEEQYSQEQLLSKIAEGATDRRRCQTQLETTIAENHETYHRIFVKKDDLRVYAMLIIAAVTMTTGFITWIGSQHSSNEMMSEIKQIIGNEK